MDYEQYDIDAQVIEAMEFALTDGVCSRLFLSQMTTVSRNAGLMLDGRQYFFNFQSIVTKIREVEQRDRSAGGKLSKPRVYKKAPLKGLMHIHFPSASSLDKNLENFWCSNWNEIVKEAKQFAEDSSRGVPWQDFLPYFLTIDAYEKRAKRKMLTGECIIFSKFGNRNYYLSLSAHNERDENVYQRIASIKHEFPELSSVI